MKDVHDYAPQAVPSMMTMERNKPSTSQLQTNAAVTGKMNYNDNNLSKHSLTAGQGTKLRELLLRLRHDTKTHGALLTPFFADFDRHHTGKITPNQFHQALCRHRFILSDE